MRVDLGDDLANSSTRQMVLGGVRGFSWEAAHRCRVGVVEQPHSDGNGERKEGLEAQDRNVGNLVAKGTRGRKQDLWRELQSRGTRSPRPRGGTGAEDKESRLRKADSAQCNRGQAFLSLPRTGRADVLRHQLVRQRGADTCPQCVQEVQHPEHARVSAPS